MKIELDATGLRCPLPVLRMEAELRGIEAGGELIISADDPVARVDIPHFCREAGHDCVLLSVDEESAICVFRVTKC